MAKATEQREPTFNLETLNTLIAQAVAEALAKERAAQPKPSSAKHDLLTAQCFKAFKRAGYREADIKPRENVKTFDKWLREDNRRVKKGETGIKVGNWRLFHVSQTEPIPAEEAAKMLAEKAARRAARTETTQQPAA